MPMYCRYADVLQVKCPCRAVQGTQHFIPWIHTSFVQVFVQSAGPFAKRGTYRMRIVLYDGFQPLLAGPDLIVGASTNRRPAVEKEGALVRAF